jgi:GNAT superfamily N-acetyltransferase
MWDAVGPFACSRSVIKELGGPIYSADGMLWLVARDSAGRVVGFASIRRTESEVWFDYGFVVEELRGRGVFAALAAERDQLAKRSHLLQRTVIRAERWKHYQQRGWEKLRAAGQWLHLSRSA